MGKKDDENPFEVLSSNVISRKSPVDIIISGGDNLYTSTER